MTTTTAGTTATQQLPLHNGMRWSGRDGMQVPAIGTDIVVTMNDLGRATVLAHQNVDGYLGLRVRLHNPPDWYVEQSKRRPEEVAGGALVFGAEVKRAPFAHYFASRTKKVLIISNDERPVGNEIPVTGKAEARKVAAREHAKPHNF